GSSLTWRDQGSLTLPFAGSASSANALFQVNNSGAGAASDGIVGTTASAVSQVAGLRGIATSASGGGGGGYGVATGSPSGTGIVGYGGATGGYFTSTQPGGQAGVFDGDVLVNRGNLEVGNGGSVRISSDPGNDSTEALVSYTLAARSAGGGMNTWK